MKRGLRERIIQHVISWEKGKEFYRSNFEISRHKSFLKEGLELTVPVIDTSRSPLKTRVEVDGKVELLTDDPTINEKSTPLSKKMFFGAVQNLSFGKSSNYFESKQEAHAFRVNLLKDLGCDHVTPEGD